MGVEHEQERQRRYVAYQTSHTLENLAIDPSDTDSISNAESFATAMRNVFEEVPVHVIVMGGKPHKRFRRVAVLQSYMSRVSTVAEAQEHLHHTPRIGDSLREIYGLNVYEDYQETILTFTDHNGQRVSSALDDFKTVTSGDVAAWRNQILAGELQGEAKCNCGKPCKGTIHTPEIHMILKLDKVMGRAAEMHQVAVASREAVPILEGRVLELEKEVGELKSEVLGLQLVKRDLEDAVGDGGGRTLRKRAKTSNLAER